MNLCSDGHDEVCYECRDCPVCDKMNDHNSAITQKDERISELETEVDQKENDSAELKAKVRELENECESLRRGRNDGEI